MKFRLLTLAAVALCSSTAQARPTEDRPTFGQPARARAPETGGASLLDHRLVVAAPLDTGRDTGPADHYIVTLGRDLPTRTGAEEAACGVLTIGGIGERRVERLIELHVRLSTRRVGLDRSADIGRRRGEVMVHLNPPSPEWTKGFLNVDFDCDGVVNAHYPIFITIADTVGGEGVALPDAEVDAEAEIEAESGTGAGCSAAASDGAPAGTVAVLGGLALLALRRRKSR